MRAFIRNIGVFFIAMGVIFVAISQIVEKSTNELLFISGGLIVIGLILYMYLNKKMV